MRRCSDPLPRPYLPSVRPPTTTKCKAQTCSSWRCRDWTSSTLSLLLSGKGSRGVRERTAPAVEGIGIASCPRRAPRLIVSKDRESRAKFYHVFMLLTVPQGLGVGRGGSQNLRCSCHRCRIYFVAAACEGMRYQTEKLEESAIPSRGGRGATKQCQVFLS